MALPTPRPTAGPELFFGLVGALGADLPQLADSLAETLETFDYTTSTIRLSSLLAEVPRIGKLSQTPLDKRIHTHQQAGDRLRERTQRGHALAALGMAAIRQRRRREAGKAITPLQRRAYVFQSLKHPDEVELLQRTYGSAFFLIAAYSPIGRRREVLKRAIAESHHSAKEEDFAAQAEELLRCDEAEQGRPLGQRVRETFPLADIFVDTSRPDLQADALKRFCEILFCHPFHTPTRDEFAMFHARAAALRSSDPSRQVGAVVATPDGDVIAVGTNEVPKPLGGLYWPGDPNDSRDFQLRETHSISMRRRMLGEMLGRLKQRELLSPTLFPAGETSSLDDIVDKVEPLMSDSMLMDIGEFGRTVHAEMASLMDAARRGVPVRGNWLYTTTFPCHNCTKHIVASGIARVVYVEPFPKSQATRLHGDAIVVDADGPVENRVTFSPFVGVAPRRYMDVFTMVPRKSRSGRPLKTAAGLTPRFPPRGSVLAYLDEEEATVLALKRTMKAVGLIDTNGRVSTPRRKPRGRR